MHEVSTRFKNPPAEQDKTFLSYRCFQPFPAYYPLWVQAYLQHGDDRAGGQGCPAREFTAEVGRNRIVIDEGAIEKELCPGP